MIELWLVDRNFHFVDLVITILQELIFLVVILAIGQFSFAGFAENLFS